MTLTFNNTLLAYLLSLRDYSQSLTPEEKKNFQEFAKQFRTYTDRLEYSEIETFLRDSLIEKIAGNTQLNQLFKTYQNKLANSEEIPSEILPKLENLIQLETSLQNNFIRIRKGEIPDLEDDTTPEGQELILHNAVILISESQQPENIPEQLSWIDKLKQWLN